jgi:disulfide bond formation protein DsbB
MNEDVGVFLRFIVMGIIGLVLGILGLTNHDFWMLSIFGFTIVFIEIVTGIYLIIYNIKHNKGD